LGYKYDSTEFLSYLRSIGNKERTIISYRSSIGIISDGIVSRYGPIAIGDITAEHVQNSLPGDLHDSTKKGHMSRFGHFLAYETGKNPMDWLCPTSHISFVMNGHLLYDFPFPSESDAFRQFLKDTDYIPTDVEKVVKHFEIATRILLQNGLSDISGYDRSTYSKLIGLTESIQTTYREKIRRSFAMYLMFRRGYNPYEAKPRTGPKELPYPYAEEVEQYRQWLEKEGFRSIPCRITALKCAVRRFGKFVDNKPLSEVTEQDMRDFRRQMYLELRETTVRHNFEMIKNLILLTTGRDVCRGYTFRFGKSVPLRKFLSEEEFRTLWDASKTNERLILAMGGAMGLRRSEMANLMMDDIRENTILVRGKGHGRYGLVKEMDMPRAVKTAMAEYLDERKNIIALYGDRSNGHLFVRYKVRPGTPMSASAMDTLLHDLSERTGVEFSTHCLRRFYATLLYQSGLSEDAIAEQMRHSKFATTSNNYLNPTDCTVEDAMERVTRELHGGCR